MPELPEVETIRRDIEPFVKGKIIKKVDVLRAKNVLRGVNAANLARSLKGQKIERVQRRGKYLIFKLASGNCLIIHLGMTGKILKKPDRFVKVTFHLSNGKAFYFSDIRMFGKVSFSKTYPVLNLGPEPLADDFTPARLKEMLKGRGGNLKALLLNQKFLAGVGNIYASEALFMAGINPKRRAGSLKFIEVKKLHKALRNVLLAGIKYRGTSVSDYRDASGRMGGYQKRLKVYDQAGRTCKKCRSKIHRIVLGQRSTFFCPHCQT